MRVLTTLLGFISLIGGCIGLLINVLTPDMKGFLLALVGTLVGLGILMRV